MDHHGCVLSSLACDLFLTPPPLSLSPTFLSLALLLFTVAFKTSLYYSAFGTNNRLLPAIVIKILGGIQYYFNIKKAHWELELKAMAIFGTWKKSKWICGHYLRLAFFVLWFNMTIQSNTEKENMHISVTTLVSIGCGSLSNIIQLLRWMYNAFGGFCISLLLLVWVVAWGTQMSVTQTRLGVSSLEGLYAWLALLLRLMTVGPR